jgi:hypothetical protein
MTVAAKAARRGKLREDHADGGSHRQHHHQGQDGADHRDGRQLVAVEPTRSENMTVTWRRSAVS